MGFLDKNVTPAKTYISTQWAWNIIHMNMILNMAVIHLT